MASGGNKSTHIRVSAEAKAILDKRDGSTVEQIDKLLGVGKKITPQKKIYKSPQNSLLDALICTSLLVSKVPQLTKTEIYSGIVSTAHINVNFSTTWAEVYEEFFNMDKDKYDGITYMQPRGEFRKKIDNRLNDASSLSKAGLIRRGRFMNSKNSPSSKYYLNPQHKEEVQNWCLAVNSLFPSDTLQVPSFDKVIYIKGLDESSPVYKGLDRTVNIMMEAHRQALKLNVEPIKYWSEKMKDVLDEDRAEGTREEYQKRKKSK